MEEIEISRYAVYHTFCAKKLYAYGAARPLEIVHGFTATVVAEHQQATADFIVVKGHGPILLGRETSTKLQLLRIGHVYDKTEKALDYSQLPIQHKKCFERIGKLKDYKLKLHIYDSVQTIAQPPRRVPVGLRDKVEREVQNLLATDIIEPAE